VVCANLSYELGVLKKRTVSLTVGRLRENESYSSFGSIPEVSGDDEDDDEDEREIDYSPRSMNGSQMGSDGAVSRLKNTFSMFGGRADGSGRDPPKRKSFMQSALQMTDVLNLGIFQEENNGSVSGSVRGSSSVNGDRRPGARHSVTEGGNARK
jgi:hypothetical protein